MNVKKERYFTFLIAVTFYTILQAQAGIRRIILKATEPCKKEQKRNHLILHKLWFSFNSLAFWGFKAPKVKKKSLFSNCLQWKFKSVCGWSENFDFFQHLNTLILNHVCPFAFWATFSRFLWRNFCFCARQLFFLRRNF